MGYKDLVSENSFILSIFLETVVIDSTTDRLNMVNGACYRVAFFYRVGILICDGVQKIYH